jgi:hypothetical protein
MKRHQSYAIPMALACTALSAFMAITAVMNGQTDARAVPEPLSEAAPGLSSVNVAPLRAALKALVAQAEIQDTPARLPVSPASVPLPVAVAPTFDANAAFHLSTVVQGGAQRSAIVNGQLVHVGERLDASTIVTGIAADAVRIKRNGETFVLTLRVQTSAQPSTEGAVK